MVHSMGNGKAMLSFDEWAADVDAIVCRTDGTPKNERTAPYAEMWLRDFPAQRAAYVALYETNTEE